MFQLFGVDTFFLIVTKGVCLDFISMKVHLAVLKG